MMNPDKFLKKSQAGFTLVELMVVVVIMAIMAAIAYPSMSEWIANRRVANRAEQVANLMRFARAEAMRRNVPITVCSVTIKRGSGEPNNNCNDKRFGMTMFTDLNRDNNLNSGEALRTVAINQNQNSDADNASDDDARVDVWVDRVRFSGTIDNAVKQKKLQNRLIFMPNGNLMIWTPGTGGQAVTKPLSGYMRYMLADAVADEELKKRRTHIVILDGSGRVSVCPRNAEGATAACLLPVF